MKNVCLVNGSLRGAKAASLEFLTDIDSRLPDTEFKKTVITVKARMKERYPSDKLEILAEAHAVIFIFPLHNYGLPGALMRLLEDYYHYAKEGNNIKKAAVYVIVNCAFPAAEKVCGETIRVMQNFCRRLALNWRFAVCIGTGPVVVMTKKIPFFYPGLKKAYAEMVKDISLSGKEKTDNFIVKPVIPAFIIAAIKRHYEKSGNMLHSEHVL